MFEIIFRFAYPLNGAIKTFIRKYHKIDRIDTRIECVAYSNVFSRSGIFYILEQSARLAKPLLSCVDT